MREKTNNLIQQKDAELNRGEEKGYIPSDFVRLWGIAKIFIEVLDDIAAALEEHVDQQSTQVNSDFNTRLFQDHKR